MVPFISGMELSLKFVSVILGNEREREREKERELREHMHVQHSPKCGGLFPLVVNTHTLSPCLCRSLSHQSASTYSGIDKVPASSRQNTNTGSSSRGAVTIHESAISFFIFDKTRRSTYSCHQLCQLM